MGIKQTLKECELFSNLNDADLEKIAGWTSEKTYEAGATIAVEGDAADQLFVLREGRVALQMALPLTKRQAARRITVDIASKNDIVGWSAIVEPHKYTFTAVCTQRTVALAIAADQLRWLLRDDSRVGCEVLRALTKVIASRLNDTRQVLVSERLLVES